MRCADARIRIETTRSFALDRELGTFAASRRRFDGQRCAFERFAGVASIDPFDARVTTIIVHDLRRTAPVGRLRRFAVWIVVSHGSSMTDAPFSLFDIATFPAIPNHGL
jgi:hypothetical protein